jgi:predicted anti-sigma-YlaC factor YlaD
VNTSADPFRYDDAAYVLGALDAADRAAFEAHLLTCAECRASVAEARAAHDLLSGLEAADLEEAAPVPDTLLPGMLRAARRERTRRRWLTVSLGAVAAACAIALVVLLWPTGSTNRGTGPLAMAAVRPSPVAATAKLVSRGWGTQIDVVCHYQSSLDAYAYKLRVIDKQGRQHWAGGWKLAPGDETNFTGGTSVDVADISRVQITLDNGTPILQLRV